MEKQTNWLTEEDKRLEESRPNFDDKESLKFEEGKVVEFDVDFSQPFDKWVDPTDEHMIKKIIPVRHDGKLKSLWLNTKNPLYAQIIKKGVEKITNFKVIQTGSGKETKYTLVEE